MKVACQQIMKIKVTTDGWIDPLCILAEHALIVHGSQLSSNTVPNT